ncbi:MAG: hypothetical protein IPG33_07925 [Betaproteobacteria bacterium]|nr:hypothetical protein [Betaproteobacteria bacterium]
MGSPERFDRDLDLNALLAGFPSVRLAAALGSLLGEGYLLRDDSGETVLAGRGAHPCEGGIPLRHQLDDVGTLSAPTAAPENLRAAAALLELLFDAGAPAHGGRPAPAGGARGLPGAARQARRAG